jgi:hypothetical protein
VQGAEQQAAWQATARTSWPGGSSFRAREHLVAVHQDMQILVYDGSQHGCYPCRPYPAYVTCIHPKVFGKQAVLYAAMLPGL